MFKKASIATVLITLLPIAIGLVMAMLLPTAIIHTKVFAHVTLWLYIIGFILFLIAKLSVIKNEKWFSVGSSHMAKGFRICYRFGYVLMVAGFIATLLLLAVISSK